MNTQSKSLLLIVSLSALASVSCGPPNVAGNYVGTATNGDNGCAIANWNVGAMYPNIHLSVMQSMMDVTGTIDGPVNVLLGSFTSNNDMLRGVVNGNGFILRRPGVAPMTRGNCNYTTSVDIEATVSGNAVTGQVLYHYTTNNMSDCAELRTCRSVQQLAFMRVQ